MRPPMWPVRAGGWRTIAIDPPWRFGDQGTRLAPEGCASEYDTMADAEILALPVGELAASSSHLYLWSTDAHLALALRCVEAWGYEYKQLLTWVKVDSGGKPRLGGGHYFRHAAEQCLFATRGRAPVRRHDLPAVFYAPRGRHSAKPAEFFDLVESASFGPRLELFARIARIGWSSWGNQLRTGRVAMVGGTKP